MPQKPTKKKKRAASAVQLEMLEELRRLNDNIDEFHHHFERIVKKQRKNRVWGGILNGFLNAIGVIVGTLIITGLLVYAGQALIRSEGFQNWAQETFERAVSDAIRDQIDNIGN